MRCPIVTNLPPVLKVDLHVPRTPVINGHLARPLKELVWQDQLSKEDIEASIARSEISPDPIWELTHQAMLRGSLAYFAGEMIKGPEEPPYNGHFLIGKHHQAWDDLIAENERVVIQAARDHGKSFFFSLAYPIWRAGWTHPGKLGYIFSATQEKASEFLEQIAEEIVANPKLHHLIPIEGTRRWSKRQIILRNGSKIRARGMGVKVRGGHPYWCICDDVLSDEDIYSETVRRRHIDYFLSSIENMVVPGGQIVVVGTPMHYADLYGYLASNELADEAGKKHEEYVCRTFPAINEKGELLFPERYNQKRLDSKKRKLKSAARFAREFLCKPLSDEASLFPSTLFEGGDVRVPYQLGLPASYWQERGMLRYTGVDFAMSAESGADYTVIFTVAVDQNKNRWLANVRWGKGWSFQRQISEIKDEYALMRPEVIHAEANQMQRIFTDEIVRETDIPIRKFFTAGVQPKQPWRKGMTSLTMGKHNIDRGVPSLRMTLENRKWRIPRGDENAVLTTDRWMGEMQAMSWQNGKVVSVGEHDDFVMAMWMCDTAVRAGGFQFSFGDKELAEMSKKPPPGAEQAAQSARETVVGPNGSKPANETIEPPQPREYRTNNVDWDDWPPKQGAPSASDLGFGGSGF